MFGKSKKEKDNEIIADLRQRIESQRVEMPVAECPVAEAPQGKVEKHKGNGKRTKEDAQNTVPVPEVAETPLANEKQPDKASVDKLAAQLEAQAAIEEKEAERNIPGNGWLFNIKDKNLKESCVLDQGQQLTFALGFMQENMLTQSRTESLFMSFAKDMMRMSVAVKGLARDQGIMARQQDADKNATVNYGRDLVGKPHNL